MRHPRERLTGHLHRRGGGSGSRLFWGGLCETTTRSQPPGAPAPKEPPINLP